MTILKQLLSEIKTDDKIQQVRELCDNIQREEEELRDTVKSEHTPAGPNIFLSLEVPGRTSKEIAFLSLERESESLYLIVLSTLLNIHVGKPDVGLKRQKVWEVSDNRPERILTEYAKTYKFLRGE